jgi:hypothetical protein
MLSILCEVASEQAAAIAGGIVAGMMVLKGGGFAWNQIRARNGGCGNGKPGYSPVCVKHLERLKALEVELKFVREGQVRMEKKLDRVLER